MSQPRKKRTAEYQLTQDNWDAEDEPQEAGQFVKADSTRIQERKIITGRRRLKADSGDAKSLFSGFGGFGAATPPKPFSATTSPSDTAKTTSSMFLAMTASGDTAKTTSSMFPAMTASGDTAKTTPATGSAITRPVLGKGIDPFKQAAAAFVAKQSPMTDQPRPAFPPKESASKPSQFLSELKSLNVKFLKSLGQYVEENPFVDLSPAFPDYSRYLAELERKHSEEKASSKRDSMVPADPQPALAPAIAPPSAALSTRPFSVPKTSSSDLGSMTRPSIHISSSPPKTTLSETMKPKNLAPTTAGTTLSFPKVSVSSASESEKDPKSASLSGFSFGLASSESKTAGLSGFSFGKAAEGTASGFSFGKPSDGSISFPKPAEGSLSFPKPSEGVGTSLGFGLGKPEAPKLGGFSFGAAKPADSGAGGEEEGEYQPPEPEKAEVEEADAFHKIRAKLFHQKDGKYADGAVGTLYLKPLDGGKVQLLLRAETKLGNILLNSAVTADTPLTLNKNNLTLFTIPSPLPPGPKNETSEEKDKRAGTPVPMLIRVKTEEDAITLLDLIKERF